MDLLKSSTAFPFVVATKTTENGGIVEQTVNHGLSKAEYFANSAPSDIPGWFVHTMRDAPRHPGRMGDLFGSGSNHEFRAHYKQYYDDEGDQWLGPDNIVPDSFKQEVAEHKSKLDLWYDLHNEWIYQDKVSRYFQWRIYYANEMVKALGGNI